MLGAKRLLIHGPWPECYRRVGYTVGKDNLGPRSTEVNFLQNFQKFRRLWVGFGRNGSEIASIFRLFSALLALVQN